MKKQKNTLKKDSFVEWLERSIGVLLGLYSIGGTTLNIHKVDKEDTSKEGIIAFRIRYSSSYKTADIWYYPCVLKLFKEKRYLLLRQALTHEIAHILTNPLADMAHDRFSSKKEIEREVEALTETIGQMCRTLMDAKNIVLK